ncbi:MAG: response regulator [Rhizobacter sp.]
MPPVPHVLTVDDDPLVRELVTSYLTDYDLKVTAVGDGRAMHEVMQREEVDLLVLDLRLGGEDGLTIARRVRETSKIPIIMLTGRGEEADRVMGLELGADDYLTKPFSPRELLARIRALLRRAWMTASVSQSTARVRLYRFAGWEVNVRLRRLSRADGTCIPLGNSEFNLLLAFLSAPQQVLSRDDLLELSRVHSAEVYDRAVDVTVGRLRRKLEDNPREPRLIITERRSGYRFDAPVDALTE